MNLNNSKMLSNSNFTPIDYSVFGLLLVCSTAIGLYFGFFGKGKQTTDEYLHGGHKMQTLPIAVSLITRSATTGTFYRFVLLNIYFNIYDL